MSRSASSGFLVVADITGYSSYLNDSELLHAQDVLATLLDLLVGHTRPPLVLSNLEGDAVLSYSIDSDRFEAQAFVENIERTYVAFKRAIDLMVMNTTCSCNACANITNLDLKFFVHHGEFVVNEVGGRQDLVGSDVNLVHRIMKNDIPSTTGLAAYAFYTDAALGQLGMSDGERLTRYEQHFEDVGVVSGGVADMRSVWKEHRGDSAFDFDETRGAEFVEDYPLPPELVWGYLTNPETRAVFSHSVKQVTKNRTGDRVAEGTVYECFHGDGTVTTNTILEWEPFHRIVSRNTVGASGSFLALYELEPAGTGTRLRMKWLFPEGLTLKERIMGFITFPRVRRHQNEGLRQLRELIEDDLAHERIGGQGPKEVSEAAINSAAQAALAADRR